MAETTPQQLGKYDLQERLGHGGMAEVWKAFDPQLQRYVALKILHADLHNDPEFVTRFQREARIIASLHHPNIVQLHDFQVSRDSTSPVTTAYMVMDYIEGQTLANYIAQTSHLGQFPSSTEIVHLFTFIGLAVDYAHQQGLVHRNIKPANILLDQRNTSRSPLGEPILTDFGMVKLLGASTGLLSSSWLGTPLYVSPEQAQGYPGNERSDIYALGVILYELCTGVLPFQGETAADILKQHISAMPLSPALINRNLPPAVTMVILRCLAKDPAARFTSASYLTTALARAFNLTVPESLSLSSVPPDIANEPTYYEFKALRPGLDSGTRLSSQPLVKGTSSPLTPVARFAQQFVGFRPSHNPLTPYPLADTPLSNGSRETSHGTSTQMPMISAAPFRKTRKKRRSVFVTLLILLFLLLLSSSLGALYWITYHHTSTNISYLANQVVGHAFFDSSGQINENTTRGLNNELQINLSNIPGLPAGKSYYAWLLSDKITSPGVSILLGTLPVTSGTVKYLYQGDQQQTNLLSTYSRLLITEEDTNSVPSHPSADKNTWRYYAELPQTPSPTAAQHFSALDHLRNLLVEGSQIQLLGIHGGLNIQLINHTQKVWEWVSYTKDSWGNPTPTSAALIHNLVVRTLDYLDGTPSIQQDVPPGTPLLVDKVLAQVPLVNDNTIYEHSSYIARIDYQLTRLIGSLGITPDMNAIAKKDDLALFNYVEKWLEKVRQDAKQLVKMSNAQLLQPSTLPILDDMGTQANYAFVGRLDPTTNEVQPGVVQIYDDIQRLATFNVKPYTSQK